jgi:hypothetical protein
MTGNLGLISKIASIPSGPAGEAVIGLRAVRKWHRN